MKTISTVNTMTLDGGAPCLDFVNSGYDREKDVLLERLHSYDDLLVLTERTGLFDKAYVDRLEKAARASGTDAAAALLFARDCREKLYRLFAALARNSADHLNPGILTGLNTLFAEGLRVKLLEINRNKPEFSYRPAPGDLYAPVWQLVLSAYDLLHDPNLPYLKQCAHCSWLFIDRTKNHRKKWCSMESCGNPQKTKRYYQLKKKQ
jgi:predicted RNA-binding Zn ribbon-like protein